MCVVLFSCTALFSFTHSAVMEEISSSETSVLDYMAQHPRIRRHENMKSRHRPPLFERHNI